MDIIELLKVIFLGIVGGNHRMASRKQYRPYDPGGSVYETESQ